MKKKLEKLLPAYAYFPLVSVAAFNFLVYFGTRFFNNDASHIYMGTVIDERIPFLPGFIVFYFLAYAQWAVGFILLGRTGKEICDRYCFADIFAKGLAMLCFLLIPTYMIRPAAEGKGLCITLVRWIYAIDAPDNLFPSIHCLESWVCLRSAFSMRTRVPRWYLAGTVVLTLLVFASTVCVKQHVFVDIPAGIAAVEIGLWVYDQIINKYRMVKK